MRYLLLLSSAIILAASGSCLMAETPNENVTLSLGLGYDQITQGYYLSVTDTLALDEDSITTLRQTSDAINAFRLKSSVNWMKQVSSNGNIELNNFSYVSDEDFRNSLDLRLRIRSVTLENQLDIRSVWKEMGISRTGYVTNSITGRVRPELASGMFFVAKNSFELVRYDGSDDFSFDYNYNKLSIGLEKEFGWTDLIAFTYRNDRRIVGDSARLNYSRHRALLEFAWSPSLELSMEVRNELMRILSNKEDNVDDAWEEFLETELTVLPSDRWRIGVKNQFEYSVFDSQDVVNFDYIYNTAELKTGYFPAIALELFIKPSAAIFWSRYEEFQDQDYEQVAAEYGLDLSLGDRLWVNASHKIGKRDYTSDTNEFYSDYILNQFNLLGDLRIYGGLNLNAIVSVDWENHDPREDDNRLSLVSIGLDYRF